MKEPEQGIRETMAGQSQHGMNPHLPTEPHNSTTDSAGLGELLSTGDPPRTSGEDEEAAKHTAPEGQRHSKTPGLSGDRTPLGEEWKP
uniref:ANKRD40 C-terminal like n=1 Tax=Mus musculus TaxID=10090 RepID=A0A9L6KDG4_MOUSE